jgi:filamentous hemagglutinin
LSSTASAERQNSERADNIGSTISATSVNVVAGKDIKVTGSTVVSDAGTTLIAGNNVNIEAPSNTSTQSSLYQKSESGLMTNGGLSISLGSRDQSNDAKSSSTTALASTVGSTSGNVTILAGKQYTQTGSDILTPGGDVNILAKDVSITEARETSASQSQQKFNQSGLTLALTSPVLSAVQTVASMSQAASQTSDSRMKALAGASAALSIRNAANAVQAGQGTTINGKDGQVITGKDANGNPTTADANAADKAGGINVSLSVGSSHSQSNSDNSSDTTRGSTIKAGGNVSIVATGAGENSNILIQGSAILAGNIASLTADKQVNLLAASNTASQSSTNSASSGSLGVGFSLGNGGAAMGVTASASKARGNADGQDSSYTNSHIGGNTVNLKSGGDSIIKGAVIAGNTVNANIGGNLNIESVQDTSTYVSKQQSVGGSVTVGAGFSGSISASKSNANSNFASVTEQSGIKAGDGGFQVNVKGNTDLKGGAITSSDKAVTDNKNTLTTASLTQSDIQNKADASASSSGLNLSSDMLSQGNYGLAKAALGNALNNAGESGSSSGQTRSAVSAGSVTITDEAKQQQLTGKTGQETVASLNRDTVNAQTAAVKQNVQEMQQTVEAERTIKQEAVKQATVITDAVYRSATGPKKIMLQKCNIQGQNCGAVEVNMKDHQIVAGPDGKVYIFNHGIMNTEQDALANTVKQSSPEALQQGVYVVINPNTGSTLGEVVYAAWDKTLAPVFGISNASQANIDVREQVKANGGTIVEVDHSRGNITSFNATQVQIQTGQKDVPLSVVQMNGSPINAQSAQLALDTATGGTAKVLQSTHQNDLVGTVLGNNPPTGGQPSSLLDAHTNYGPNVQKDDKYRVWGAAQGSVSAPTLQSPMVGTGVQP